MIELNRRTLAIAIAAGVFAPFAASAQVSPPPDPSLADHPLLNDATRSLTQRRWGRLASLVRALPPQSAVVLIDDLGDVTQVDLNLDGLARERTGATIAGGLLVNWGWRFRGGGFAPSVGGSAFAAFQQRLQTARTQLVAALAEDADDGVAAAMLIRTQKGLQDIAAMDDAFHKFEQAARRPISGYSGYADAISGKWYGSQERMLGFARQHRGSLPPSSQGLIPQAHIETMLSFASSSDSETAARAASYLTEAFVRGELIAANDAFYAAAPDADNYANRFAYGQFSYAFMQMGERDLARPHVAGMGASPAGPWTLLPDARHVLQRLRRDLGLADL